MKKPIAVYTSIMIAAIILITTGLANAKDKILTINPSRIEYKQDKNGNEYGRIIAAEPRSLNGISYTASVPVMFFGEMVEKLKNSAIKVGETSKIIVSTSIYNDKTSYNALAIIAE